MIKMIVCTDIKGGIGFNNDLLYNIKEDMQFFKDTTTGHKIVMGYNTWVSLPKKPLPNRDNYILYNGDEHIEESENVHVIKNLFQVAKLGAVEDIFIIGGAQLYNDMIQYDLIDEAYVTLVVDINYSADKFIQLYKLGECLPKRELIKKIVFNHYYTELEAYIFKYTK